MSRTDQSSIAPAPAPAAVPPVAPAVAVPRRRDAALSRQRLLTAASELFAERGYERATIRDIGQRAGVDSTLITRYFGGKAALYLATLPDTGATAAAEALDVTNAERVRHILDRAQFSGSTPTLHGAVMPHTDPALQAATLAVLRERILIPAERLAEAADLEDCELRAEMAAAALAGIVLSRTSGALASLAAASADDLARLTAQMLATLLSESATPDRSSST